MKKFLFLSLLLILFTNPASANMVWPSVYISEGMISIYVIITGLLIELLFVKFFTDVNWLKASIVTFVMNLTTSLLGIILIPISGLIVELLMIPFSKTGTFHWTHWLLAYVSVVLMNTLIEGLVVKLMLKRELKNIFWWLLIANTISVLICVLKLHFLEV